MRTAPNIQPRLIYEELYAVHGDRVPYLETVQRWCKRFREGQDDLEDEARSGRPVSKTTSENIEQGRLIIDDDPRVTIEKIQEQTGLSYGTTQRIITDHLKMTKITARDILKQLTDPKRNDRVRICEQTQARYRDGTWRLCNVMTVDESWFYHRQPDRKPSYAALVAKGDPPSIIIRRDRFAPKTLFSIFFISTGPLLIHHAVRGQTINRRYYIDNSLQSFVDEIRHGRALYGKDRIVLHQDNGKPHVHYVISGYSI